MGLFINGLRIQYFPNKECVYMKKLYMYITGLVMLFCCISEYEPNTIDKIEGLLVVEGMITNDTTEIRLSRSVKILMILVKKNR